MVQVFPKLEREPLPWRHPSFLFFPDRVYRLPRSFKPGPGRHLVIALSFSVGFKDLPLQISGDQFPMVEAHEEFRLYRDLATYRMASMVQFVVLNSAHFFTPFAASFFRVLRFPRPGAKFSPCADRKHPLQEGGKAWDRFPEPVASILRIPASPVSSPRPAPPYARCVRRLVFGSAAPTPGGNEPQASLTQQHTLEFLRDRFAGPVLPRPALARGFQLWSNLHSPSNQGINQVPPGGSWDSCRLLAEALATTDRSNAVREKDQEPKLHKKRGGHSGSTRGAPFNLTSETIQGIYANMASLSIGEIHLFSTLILN